jgi:ADP-heptose:LPS heptosyltransferase
VVIFRALQLGDLLCAVPAWRALRAALPQAHITLAGLPWAGEFAARFHRYLDGFIEFPGLPGFPEIEPRLHEFPGFLEAVQRRQFDLALQMQGSGPLSNTLVALFAARRTAGFTLPGCYAPDPELFMPYPEGEPEVRRHLRLMEFLGFPSQGEALEFPLEEADWLALDRALEPHGGRPRLERDGYVCVHPGARAPERRWPAGRFAAVAEALVDQGLRVALTGAAAEAELARAVLERMGPSARERTLNLAGATTLGAAAALLCGARLLLSNDTGVSHLAAALRVPSLILFTASDPQRWAPLDRSLHRPLLDASRLPAEQVQREALAALAGSKEGSRAG